MRKFMNVKTGEIIHVPAWNLTLLLIMRANKFKYKEMFSNGDSNE